MKQLSLDAFPSTVKFIDSCFWAPIADRHALRPSRPFALKISSFLSSWGSW